MIRDAHRFTDGVIFLLFLSIGLVLYSPVFSILPLDGDNLYVLALVHSASLSSLLQVDPAIYPEWRPLAYLTVWLEHRLLPFEAVAVHFFVNIAILAVTAWLIYRIVTELTATRAMGVAAALIVLVDRRLEEAVIWIVERQMLLACMFGLMVVLLLVRARDRSLSRREWFGIGALLVASGLSKEYGLAFTLMLGAYGVWRRRPAKILTASAALGTYVSLRLAVAGGATGAYCEDMGFLFAQEYRCIDLNEPATLGLMVYNVVTSAIATAVTGMFGSHGVIDFERRRLAMSLFFLIFATLGVWKGPRPSRMIALLPLTTGVMCFMLFRHRNLLPGMMGFAIVAGVGMAIVWRRAPAVIRPACRVAMLVVMGMVFLQKAFDAHEHVAAAAAETHDYDPCLSPLRERAFTDSYVAIVNRTFGLREGDCPARD